MYCICSVKRNIPTNYQLLNIKPLSNSKIISKFTALNSEQIIMHSTSNGCI